MSQGIFGASNDPLHGISDMLHRLETYLAGQDARLQFIESYIRSGATPLCLDGPSIREETSESLRISQSSKSIRPRDEAPDTLAEIDTLAAAYRASLFDLRTRFLNSSDIKRDERQHQMHPKSGDESGMESLAPQINRPPVSVHPSGNLDLIYDDAYSVSVYPSEPFTRSELFNRSEADIPPVPALRTVPNNERLSTDDIGPLENSIPYSSTVSAVQAFSQAPPTSPISRSSSLRFWKTRSNRDTIVTTESTISSACTSQTRQPHIRAEMTYHAYENLRHSVFSSTEKRASREEIHRLQDLAVPVTKNADIEKDSRFFGLYKVFSRFLGNLGPKRPSLVFYIA